MPRRDQKTGKKRYALIPRTLIFITRGDEVLMLQGAMDKPLWANKLNGIGGHVEPGEDILSAARRELAEETGLHVQDLWLCGTITIDTGEDVGIGIFVFRGNCPQGEPADSPEGELVWISLNQIHNFNLVEDLPTLLPQVLKMEPGAAPFSAHYSYDNEDQLVITMTGGSF